MIKQTLTLILGAGSLMLASCGAGKAKGTKGHWTQDERKEFMSSCISSAKKSYEQRGQQGDSVIITTLCKCSGEIIEERYGPDESAKIKPEEVNEIMMEAAKKCLVK